MLKIFNKKHLSALLALLVLNTASSLTAEEYYYPNDSFYPDDSFSAEDCCLTSCQTKCNRFYIGAFGGGLYSNSVEIIQMGTALFLEAQGGPLAVDARGRTDKNSAGFGGIQLGYELAANPCNFGCSGWGLTPGVEFEAFWYRHTKKGDLLNPTDRLDEHDFLDTFPMRMGLYLFNGTLSLNNCCFGNFTPYIGGGFGPARISIRNADSLQVAPLEAGINHFNSNTSNSTWTVAAQAKVGVRYNFLCRFHVFAEYRYVFVDSSNYILGSTIYPTHAPTTIWNVNIKNINYNAFALGLQFDL
ncbi:outer membrane protein [Criblamydia sequanensis]|uniref:Secreted protein n=1 Tax=Candidatus Criblamydia sequanensis CRIB-18 TaxID=1437425 RepID=A0A090D2R9_9BACT|nr:outer membrane beta-barrel protein [Criblamydia sequanensis]CDR34875.1 putative secreted protein [Criblamydia sequanensis CRIB-18]